MKQVVVSVEEKKFDFFMELLNSFDFVSVHKHSNTKAELLRSIAGDMKVALLASQGKAPSRSAKEFLSEL